MERHLHPSIYKKIRKTKKMLQKGIDPKEFSYRGGLDLKTFNALQNRWKKQQKSIEERKEQIISTYGSLKNVPSSSGPCRRHDPVVGTKNALVLLAEFKDKKHTYKPEKFRDLLFSKGSNYSMRDYYLEASWNQLDIIGHVNDKWYTSSNNRFEYSDNMDSKYFPNAQKLAEETILNAKNSGKIDFSPYAKDGKIEILIVIYAGSGMDTKHDISFIRPHKDRLLKPIELQEGILADQYCLIPELPIDNLGCYCHEVAHFLGLPDLYLENYSTVVGGWCLMGMGHFINEGRTPSHPSAWCKIHLGWIEPELLNKKPQNYEIPAIIDAKIIYRLDIEGSGGKEYFLLENRQQKGFDKYLPGGGLLIWYVNENACIDKKLPNSNPDCFFLTLKQSDGKDELQRDMTELIKRTKPVDKPPKDWEGDLGDPFPGMILNRAFNDDSDPNSRSYKDKKSFIKVDSISDSKDIMTAEIGIESKNVLKLYESDKIFSKSTNEEKTSQIFTNPYFLNVLYSTPKEKTPYEKGFEDAKKEFFEELKEKSGINSYRKGYQRGFKKGYEDAFKSSGGWNE